MKKKMLFNSKISLSLLTFLNLFFLSRGLFEECNHTLDLKAGHKIFINSPFYPKPYPAGTSCRYTLRAPRDYQLDFKCNIDINVTYTTASSTAQLSERCYDEIFYFNREGSELLSGSEYFCGHGSMERRSFLNRAVISYISAGPPRRLASVGVKGVTVSSTTSTTANTQNYQNKNKKKKKHKNKQKKPSTIQISSETSADISNPFTYLTTLLSNTIETSVFIAPATQQTHKHTKPKDNRGKLTKPTRRGSTAGSNDLLTFSPEPLNIYNGRNASISIPATTLTTITITKNVSTEDFKPTSSINTPLVSRDYRILSNPQNYAGYPAGAGNGRFSCLVESVASQCDCGWSPHTLKVVSPSSAAGLNEYSSMAGVLTIDYGKIFCGAVIIHHRYLLSAAHCFISAATNSSDLLQVVVGEHDLSTVLESVYTHYYRVNAIILHEQFRATFNQVRNDIALLRTSQAMVWNRGVAPACLPFHSITGTSGGLKPPIVGQLVETAGWGSISFGGPQSSLLLSAQLDVIGVEECRRWLGALPPATFCTYTPGRDTCQYDSGGGLYMREGGRLFVVGIVSYGYGCAARRPSVNTKVASYMRWIKSKTESVTYCVK